MKASVSANAPRFDSSIARPPSATPGNQKSEPTPTSNPPTPSKKPSDYVSDRKSSSNEVYNSFLTVMKENGAVPIPRDAQRSNPRYPTDEKSNLGQARKRGPPEPLKTQTNKGPSLSHLLGTNSNKRTTIPGMEGDGKGEILGEAFAALQKRRAENEKNKDPSSKLSSVVNSLNTGARTRMTKSQRSPPTAVSASAVAASRIDKLQLHGARMAFERRVKHEHLANTKRMTKAMMAEKIANETVELPSHTINLKEASLLFRVATKKLRRILRVIGEFPEGGRTISDEDFNIEPEVLELVAMELNRNFEVEEKESLDHRDLLLKRRAGVEGEGEETGSNESLAYESLPTRPPVVCIMGHVDHGKTTLMDTLRRMSRGKDTVSTRKAKKKKRAKTANKDSDFNNVAGTEAGGITQVISAFQVPMTGHETGSVTFLDTPGHAAFKSMRQSGSDAADIIVLVVAADDGVSPQTVEILNFYKSIVKGSSGSGISLVVALNKIDKPGVVVEQAKLTVEGQLVENGIMPEGMIGSSEGTVGAPVQVFPISALTGEGIDDLVEGLALQSEVMDLRADDAANGEGYVMDARIEKGLGTVADCVIRWGTVRKGDYVVCGLSMGKVKTLKDVDGKMIKKASPSQPVRVVGFDSVPQAGEPLVCMSSMNDAKDLVERRKAVQANMLSQVVGSGNAELQSSGKHLMQNKWREELKGRYGMDKEDEDSSPVRIPVIIRADADGSLSALREAMMEIADESRLHIQVDPIVTGVGPVLPSEVEMAKESNASIFCFNIKNDGATLRLADTKDVRVINDDVIYRLLEESRDIFSSYLPTKEVEHVHGRAKVGKVFEIGGLGTVAGLNVTEGNLYKEKVPSDTKVPLRCFYRVLRKGEVISKGLPISTSLKHFKDDVEEVSSGMECGLSIDGHSDYEEGDIIECFSIEEVKQEV